MAAHTQNEKILRDGAVVIYQRTDVASVNWHCRIKFPDHPYIRKSLKCKTEAEAIRNANKLYDDLRFRFERGFALSSQPFIRAAEEQFNWLEDQIEAERDVNKAKLLKRKLTDHRNTARYAIEYFDKVHIDKITDLDIERYKEWRKTYWTRGPGVDQNTIEYVRNGRKVKAPRPKSGMPALSTLAREDVVLRAVFDRARKLGWVTADQIPEIKSDKPKSNRRPAFNESEIQKLLSVADSRIKEAQTVQVKYLRGMLRDFIGLLATTGMRPFEAMGLRGGDIQRFQTENGKWATKIFVKGKGKKRTLIARDEADQYVFEIYKRVSERKNLETGFVEDIDGPIFCMPDGRPIKSFKKGLRALLDATNLRTDSEGQVRDTYSFRHYYATQRLLKGISVYTLAENMGTGVSMIEKHYGHLKPELAADELTRE